MSDPVSFKYRAFLSYAHADLAWGKWLHGQLEAYRLDRDLVGRETALGPVPKSLRPIFRDREDFSGGHTLTDATIAALDASAALIVLCSTVAATRPAVNEEVRLFRSRHPDRPVVPVIVEGHYPTNFPQALLFELSADGSVTDNPITMLAPDLRGKGDGRTLGLAKVVAGLTGLAPDDIYRRAVRAQQRANAVRAGLAALLLLLAAGGGYFLWQSQQRGAVIVQQQQIEAQALAIATQMLGANPAAAATPGTKDNLVAALTAVQQQVAAGDTDYTKASELLKQGKAAEALPLLIAAAEAKQRRAASETKSSAKAYREAAAIAAVAEPGKARALYAEAARLDPDDVEGMFQNASFQLKARALAEVERAYGRVLSLGKPGTDDDRLVFSHFGLGDILSARGQLEPAKAEYRLGGDAAKRLAKSDPGNAGWQRDLSVSYNKVGDVLVAQGNLPEALKMHRDSLAIADRLTKSDPGNAGWQRDLVVSHAKLADVASKSDDTATARAELAVAREISARLAALSPDNANWKNDLAWIDRQLAALGAN